MFRQILLAGACFVLAACATPAAAPSNQAELSQPVSFDQAVAQLADELNLQFAARPDAAPTPRGIVLDPMLESSNGQQTAATQRLEKSLRQGLAQNKALDWLVLDSAALAKARYLMAGTFSRLPSKATPEAVRLDVAIVDLKTGNVVAHAAALARSDDLDRSPLPYFRDSPVLVRDSGIDGYVRTAATEAGRPGDRDYLDRLGTAASIDEATQLYNAGQYAEALARYRAALKLPTGERQMRALNGAYLSLVRLGRMAEAELAFGKVAAAGIAYKDLGVKLLFNPGKTDFWSDARVSGPYPMWLRQIARESSAVKACLAVVGHTSRTGSEISNDSLSLQRANAIRQRLTRESPDLSSRITASGMGSRENIVGSGTDNVVDALDRRVEFRIVPCDSFSKEHLAPPPGA